MKQPVAVGTRAIYNPATGPYRAPCRPGGKERENAVRRLCEYGRAAVLTVLALTVVPGCPGPAAPPPGDVPVPEPLNLLLPKRMRIHPFSDVTVAPDGTWRIEVRIEAVDAFGDATKMFGEFRFEAYALKPVSTELKGRLMETWDASIMTGKANLVHWDSITRTYVFKLDWDKPSADKQPFVMRAVFASKFSKRFLAEMTFEWD